MWELYNTGSGWRSTNLPAAAGSGALPPITPASPLAGYAFDNQSTEHVIYLDSNGQVHELYRAGDAWNAGETSS